MSGYKVSTEGMLVCRIDLSFYKIIDLLPATEAASDLPMAKLNEHHL
jgi:hypothetical protein